MCNQHAMWLKVTRESAPLARVGPTGLQDRAAKRSRWGQTAAAMVAPAPALDALADACQCGERDRLDTGWSCRPVENSGISIMAAPTRNLSGVAAS